MSDYAKFSATLAKVNFNGKKTVVTLELDNRSAASNIDFLMENIDETVNVSLGDPQMKLDLPPGQPRTGVAGTIGPNGVVESVETADDDEDGEQEEMDLEDEVDEEGETEPDYTGKTILFNRGDKGQIVFPIADGYALSPQITKVFGESTYTHTMGEGEVLKEIGVNPLPISETGGKAGRYLVSELLAFGGELVDAPDEVDGEPDVPYEVGEEDLTDEAADPIDDDMDFTEDEEQAS